MEQINQSNAVVAFIDILGFKDLVVANNKSKDNAILNSIQKALSSSFKAAVESSHQLLPTYGATVEEKEFLYSKLKYRLFSDNLFIAFEYEDDRDYEFAVYWICSIALNYQRRLLQENIYVRGGIAKGRCHFGEHVIFSDALIKAYELESKVAKYPRIVVDNNVLLKLNKVNKEHVFRRLLNTYLVKDWSGIIFLDPFTMLRAMDKMINNLLKQNNLETIEFFKKIMSEVAIHVNSNPSPDFSDEDLIEYVWENIKREIKRHKKNREIQEKYLWLREFVDWNGDYLCNIEFKFLYK